MSTAEIHGPLIDGRRLRAIAWGVAMTLHERAQIVSRLPKSGEAIRRAATRLGSWAETFGLASTEILEYWSNELDLSEADVTKIVGATADQLESAAGTPPPWMATLHDVFGALASGNVYRSENHEDGGDDVSIDVMARPWIDYALSCAYQRLNRGTKRSDGRFSDETLRLFTRRLRQRLCWCFERTCLLELNITRLRGQLSGATSEERFQFFCRRLTTPDVVLAILREYPVLARLLAEETERWITYVCELLTRLESDWPMIRNQIFNGHEVGTLVDAELDAGDTHNGGRAVAILEFESGAKLVYKPRSTAGEQVFGSAVLWLNRHIPKASMKSYEVLSCGSYGWCEYVEPAECRTGMERHRFYFRQGQILALAYGLRMIDLYCENIIAAGEHPVVIDAESIMNVMHPSDLKYPRMSSFEQSLMTVGTLPSQSMVPGDGTLEMSGLFGGREMVSPFRVPLVEGERRDDAQVVLRQVSLKAANNTPGIGSELSGRGAYLNDIVQGFSVAYRLLSDNKTAFLKEVGADLAASDSIRYVPRPSRVYAKLLSSSTHPNLLRDALDRDMLFTRLWSRRADWRRALVKAERADLWAGGVPIFVRQVQGGEVWSSSGEPVPAIAIPAAISEVKERIANLAESDLNRHLWTITTALALTPGEKAASAASWPSPADQHCAGRQTRLIELALQVGRRLMSLAATARDTVGWLEVKTMEGNYQHGPTGKLEIAGMSHDLNSGIAGMALFFHYLAAVSNEESIHEFAARLRRYMFYITETVPLEELTLGLLNGIAGMLYVLSHVGTAAEHEKFESAAARSFDAIRTRPAAGSRLGYDISSGSAGIICALLSYYAVAPADAVLDVAIEHGEHIVRNSAPETAGVGWKYGNSGSLAGFAHGAAGIGLALSRLFEITGIQRFQEVAAQALAFERSLFDEELGGWPDRRDWVKEFRLTDVLSTSWCTGSAGIGLSRLALRQWSDDPSIAEEIEAAFKSTFSALTHLDNDCICHGAFGQWEFLETVAANFASPTKTQRLEQATEQLLSRVERQGFRFEGGVESLSLMTGLAGCGYALLRLAQPNVVPSVLLFNAPPAGH